MVNGASPVSVWVTLTDSVLRLNVEPAALVPVMVTVGAAPYLKLPALERTPYEVTVTGTDRLNGAPAWPVSALGSGAVASHAVDEGHVTSIAGSGPNHTWLVPSVAKLFPRMRTRVPPPAGPLEGETDLTVTGAGVTSSISVCVAVPYVFLAVRCTR